MEARGECHVSCCITNYLVFLRQDLSVHLGQAASHQALAEFPPPPQSSSTGLQAVTPIAAFLYGC